MHLRIHTAAALVLFAAMAHAQGVVRDIVVNGNTRVNREAILSTMSLKVGAQYTEEKRAADETAIQGLGFFSAVKIVATPTATGEDFTLRVDVEEYPVIKEVRITGNTVVKTEDIMAKLTANLRPGAILNLNERATASDAIRKLYSDKGYVADIADFGPLEGSPGTLSLMIVETKVGEISVQGNKFTKDRVIKRLIHTRPGEVYSKNRWFADLARIQGTGWFDTINTDPSYDRELGAVDLMLDLKEARTGTFNVGLQLDPQNSLAGIIRYSQSNVGGTGQSFGVNLLQSTQGVGPSIDLDYTNPFIDNHDTTFRASIYSRVVFRFQGGLFGTGGNTSFTRDDQYYERRTGVNFGFSRPLRENLVGSLSLRAEGVSTNGLKDRVDSNGDPVANFIRQDGPVAVGALGVTREGRDTTVNPSRGDWLQLTAEPGFSDIQKVGGFTSDTGIVGPNLFGKLSFEYRRYLTGQPARVKIDDPRRVLAFRVRGGTVLGQVPFFEQYFAGGAQSVRGYSEDRFWGKNTLVLTTEYRYPIQRTLSVIGFVDYGGAWGGYGSVNSFSQTDTLKLHLGFGPGISFNAGPLGNIQLYLGFNETGGTRTHFLIGTSF